MNNNILSGSYLPKDVTFLLKNINGLLEEKSNEVRENAIQSGVHYSKMLPIEYHPSTEYMRIFHESLQQNKIKLAELVAYLSEKILKNRGEKLVLVSLARAGTPIGILLKRYMSCKYNIEAPHYSISIIRDVGIDENALKYILKEQPQAQLQFVDGWTGKGVIQATLVEACHKFFQEYGININPDLAVISDPAYCTETYATREDFLIPSACLNSTVSGLISRTVYNEEFISKEDFHGAKYYNEWNSIDLSRFFIDTITEEFPRVKGIKIFEGDRVSGKGYSEVEKIQAIYKINNINLIKPGVGETTRVLLRRIPWRILVDSMNNPNLKHIYILAADRNVKLEIFKDMSYSCCGIIKPKELGDL